MAPVIRALRSSAQAEVVVISTGQHAELLHDVLRFFEIAVDADLNLMRSGRTQADLAGRMIRSLDRALKSAAPQFVLAQGDTTTAFAAALCSFYRQIPFGHVEAGLRTGVKSSPFPEEMHRVLAGRLADLHFAPTSAAAENLRREGVDGRRIIESGNTAVDALRWTIERGTPRISADFGSRKVLLATVHRRENAGRPLSEICGALRDLAARPDVQIVCTVHPNPAVGPMLRRCLDDVERILLLDPLEYPEFVAWMRRADLILTDSGGIQEEAPYLGKPVLVLRDTTERSEAVAAGSARVVGTSRSRIVRETRRLLDDRSAYEAMARVRSPFGDGRAAMRIKTGVLSWRAEGRPADEVPAKQSHRSNMLAA